VIGISITRQDYLQGEGKTRQELDGELENTAGKKNVYTGKNKRQNPGKKQ